MPYVERTDGAVTGLYTSLVSGVAEEFLPDDSPEVVAFLNAPPPLIPVSNRQFYHQLALIGRITQDEALEAMSGTLPGPILDIISEQDPGDEFRLQMAYLAIRFRREDETVTLLQEHFSFSDEYMDQFFRDAAALE